MLEERVDGSLSVRYIDGPSIDDHLGAQDGRGVSSFNVSDHLGSVTDISDAAGGRLAAIRYDPWGNMDVVGLDSAYRFTGRVWDVETSLYYYRARYYSTDLARFISEDPIRLYAGADFYSYTQNNPLRRFDPWGLDWIEYTGEHLTLYSGMVGDQSRALRSCRATSGQPQAQLPQYQSRPDVGPLPEGLYRINVALDPTRMTGVTPDHQAVPGNGVQRIPGNNPDSDWGTWRARLEPVRLNQRLPRPRGNFYLHNSHKGYTHGCIETCDDLYDSLRDYHNQGLDYLPVRIRYSDRTTNGGTRR